jgi:hypothetical protein
MPERLAKLEDYGGHLATHQKEMENALVVLVGLLAKPPTKDFPQKAHLWSDTAMLQGNRFPGLREKVVTAYRTAHPNKKIKTMADLPPEYNGAIEDWERKWDWLSGDGYQAYYRIKWFQLQAKNNEEMNTPLGKRAWVWLQHNTGLLESALYGANEEIKRGDVAAFERRIKIAKDYKSVVPATKRVYSEYKRDWEKFFRDTKPEKVGKFMDWFNGWVVNEDAWPSLHNLKTAMIALATKSFARYLKSYKDMVKIWTPVIDAKFLTAARTFTKDFEMRSLDRDYRFAIDALSRQMYQRR